MQITFAYDKKAEKAHYKVRHSNIQETEFTEAFSNPLVVIGQRGHVLKAIGQTFRGRFLTVVFLRMSSSHYHVITAWPSTKSQILNWHKELRQQ